MKSEKQLDRLRSSFDKDIHQLLRLENIKNVYLKHGMWQKLPRLCRLEHSLIHGVMQQKSLLKNVPKTKQDFSFHSASKNCQENFYSFLEVYERNCFLLTDVNALCDRAIKNLEPKHESYATYGESGKLAVASKSYSRMYQARI